MKNFFQVIVFTELYICWSFCYETRRLLFVQKTCSDQRQQEKKWAGGFPPARLSRRIGPLAFMGGNRQRLQR